ncbi:MAG: gliding motility-associated C-terminal domain-containing protein [Bacteroidales bacterium]|nr:gliding motility-associated C-terminal domain-containing protein [Bacteroidales bacterium]
MAQEHKFIDLKNNKKELSDGVNLLCFDVFEIRIAITNAEGMCTWTVDNDSKAYLEETGRSGAYGDTITYSYTAVKDNSKQLSIKVAWINAAGTAFSKTLYYSAACDAAKPGSITVLTKTGANRIGYEAGAAEQTKEVYCEGLQYQLKVDEGPARDYSTLAPLQYGWFVASGPDKTGSRIDDYKSGSEKNSATASVSLSLEGRYWQVRAKTCDDGYNTDPQSQIIENIIRKTILPNDVDLTVKHIRYAKPKSGGDDGGGMGDGPGGGTGGSGDDGGPRWLPIDESEDDKELMNIACVHYSNTFNSKSYNINGASMNSFETVSGYIDLEAGPFDIKEDILFPHYRFRWIFDTADLEIATDKMVSGTVRCPDSGFGVDRSRICFKIKEHLLTKEDSVQGKTRDKIKVSVEVYCPECEAEAAKNGATDTEYRKMSKDGLTLTRIDSLPKYFPYTISMKDAGGSVIDEIKTDVVPELCGLRDYNFCSNTKSDVEYSGNLTFMWVVPSEKWKATDGIEGCKGITTPEITLTETHFGDTCNLYVYPRNQCFQNGSLNIHRDTIKVYVKALPPAPKIYDPVDTRNPVFTGLPEDEVGDEMEKFKNKPSILLCNYNKEYNNLPNRDYYLISRNSPIPPQKFSDHAKEGGYVMKLPEDYTDEDITYEIRSIDGSTEANDTNIIRIIVKEGAYAKLKGQTQLTFGFASANECGAGSSLYFPVNIIDTLNVFAHVKQLDHSDPGLDSVAWACEGEVWQWTLEKVEERYRMDPLEEKEEGEGSAGRTGAKRNTDRVDYIWNFTDPTWHFFQASSEGQNPTAVVFGSGSGQVRLALRNRCGLSKPRAGDYVNVNPYTRVKIKVTGANIADAQRDAYDPLLAPGDLGAASNQEFLVQPCRNSSLVYAADTSYLTEEYLWCFPSDWRVLDAPGYETATWIGTGDSANFARTKNTDLLNPNAGIDEMRVMVHVGADTGDVMVIGRKSGCHFAYDNVAPDLSRDELPYGHRADSLRVLVRPFTGKPMQAEPWPDSICVRNCTQQECAPNVMSLAVIPDITQDSLTRAETRFTWKFPADYEPVVYSNIDTKDSRDKRNILTFTVPDRVGDYDTITVYSHRFDCEPYNEGDSMVVIIKLTDTIPFSKGRYLNDARRPESRLNTTPCEGDTVVYRILPDPKKYLDSVWFTWNGGNKFEDTAKGLIDSTGWRVLNPVGRYADTLKMIVGRSTLTLGAQAVSPCGMSSVFSTVFKPIGLVRDTVHLVQGRELLCLNEKVTFEWDSVKYATQYDWFYPWGKQHDTLKIKDKMFYREFSRRTAFETGYIYVRPSNSCGVGPYSDSVTVGNVIRHLGVPTVTGQDAPEFLVLRDTLYDTLCLRTQRIYEASYSDPDYEEGLEWHYRWFNFATNAQDTVKVAGTDSSLCRFANQAGFEDKYIGVAVHHKECASFGDTLILRIRPADTVAIDEATLADRLSDWEREDKTIMTRPCGNDTAEWHFNSDFGSEKVQYRFVWWDSLSQPRLRQHDPDGSMVVGDAKKADNFTWLNPKTESSLDDAWYSGDEDFLKVSIPNNQLLYLSVDLKNRCGISKLPSLAIRTVVSIADSTYKLQQLSSLVCDGDSLVFRVDSSANIGGFIWHYPWGKTVDTVKVGTQVVRTFNAREYQTGEVYVVPFNGCGLAHESNKIEITDVLRIPSRAVPVDFDLAYDAAKSPIAKDTLCMRTRQVLHVRSESWTEDGEYEKEWHLKQGNLLGFDRGADSCVLQGIDVNAEPFELWFFSRVKGCRRYSDTLQIRVLSMDTLTFAMVEDEDAGLGRLEVLLPSIVQNYADNKTPIDRNPCGGTVQKYTIADNIHWSVVSDASSYFSWNAKGEAPQIEPKPDSAMGSTDWKFVGQPIDGYGYRDLPLIVGVKDELQLHVNLRNICGTSQSPALSVVPKPAVTQAPTITPAPICLGAKLGFDCQEVDNALEYHWTFPWAPQQKTTEIPHVDIPMVTDQNGDVKVRAYNECGFGPEATFNAMVIHTPKAPLPDWNPQENYTKDADTVTDVICLYSGGIRLNVKQDESDAPNVQFEYALLRGETMNVTKDGIITPNSTATKDSSVLLAVYGYYSACGGRGLPLYIRLGYEDTISSADLGKVVVPADWEQNPAPCPEEEIELQVENNIAPAYKWVLPATWKFKEGTDTTAAKVTVIAGTRNGRIGVSPITSFSELGCGSLIARPIYSVTFEPRKVPVTPGFSGFAERPCVGSQVIYRIEQSTAANNIKAYRWEFPKDWRIAVTDAAVAGPSGDTNVLPVTPNGFCPVVVGKDSGNIQVYAMDSCGERLVGGNPTSKAVYPVDTARLQVLGDQNVCLDSTVYLSVSALNPYTDGRTYGLQIQYVASGDKPLAIEFEDGDSTRIKIQCVNRDTAKLIFTPYNLFSCPDNVEPVVHYLITDTVPEIPGVIEGREYVCEDNPYVFIFHVDPEKKAIFDEISYSWAVPQGWHIDSVVNDTVLHAYFDTVADNAGDSRQRDTILCYPRSGCGTAYPTAFVVSIQPQDEFADSIRVARPDPCLGTELKAWLKNGDSYNLDTIRFFWNTPEGWTRLDEDVLPQTSYLVHYDTASYIGVRYERDGGCGMSRTINFRVTVKDSAAKACFEGMEYPCFSRSVYEMAVAPDPEHIDSVKWFYGDLTATVHTRRGSYMVGDSLVIDNAAKKNNPLPVTVRSINECGSRDTVFTIRPITEISDFNSPIRVPRYCLSDTGYAYIDLTNAQRNQGLFFEWRFEPDSVYRSLKAFVAGDTAAVLQYLAGAVTDTLQIVLLAGNDCSRLADSMLSPKIAKIAPFEYRIFAAYDTSYGTVYGTERLPVFVAKTSAADTGAYTYRWQPESELYPLADSRYTNRRYTKMLIRDIETYYVDSRQKAADNQVALPFYRRDGLCYAHDTLHIRIDSLLSVLFEGEQAACMEMEKELHPIVFGANVDRMRIDTSDEMYEYGYMIDWYRWEDSVWVEMEEFRDNAVATVMREKEGEYLYRVVVNDNTIVHDSTTEVTVSHADTADVWLHVYGKPTVRFVNVSSDPVEVPVGSRISVQTDVYDGTGEYVYCWTSSPDTTLILPGYDSESDIKTHSIYQASELRIVVWDTLSGCIASNTLHIRLGKGSDIPNAFTPNGDGKNDVFLKGVSELTIFTRWGEEIYHTTQGEGWDGTYRNKKVRPGEYLYVAVVRENGKDLVFKGVVSVLTVD